MKHFTSIEQSKKLLKLGLCPESADMRYGYIAPYEYSDRMFDGGYDEIPYPKDFMKRNPNFSENEYGGSLPCWSVGALLELMPFLLTNGIQVYSFNICKELDKDGEAYRIRYSVFNTNVTLYKTDYHNTSIDACFEMVCWLLENGYIKKGE